MKAVIMAGGRGTRLSPLTCNLPKPMVPLLDYPCMLYIIDLLKKHGIREIGVTLQYLPQTIKSYFGDGSKFGVKLHYFEELSPLGTAGSIKNAEQFLDQTFLVISGDAFTDFNLGDAINFHQKNNSLATLVLTRVEIPLEYGVVMTEPDGRIIRFIEKPSWNEVFSDTINTGIYVLEPSILQLCPSEQKFDFSKDLFPLLLNDNLPMYGYVARGYWSDIGNLNQYKQTQFDMLSGITNIKVRGKEYAPGVWVGRGVRIHEGAELNGPAFIGGGSEVHPTATVGPFSVIGRNSRIETGANIQRSVLWNSCYVGKEANLAGAILANGVQVGEATIANENCVLGGKSHIKEQVVLKHGVKIWPGKYVESGSIVQSSLIWGNLSRKTLFGPEGISGLPNIEITPELVVRIIAAYASLLQANQTVSVSCDFYPYSSILKLSVVASLLANGICVRDVGKVLAPVARFECRNSESVGGIHLRKLGSEDKVLIQFFDQQGLPIDIDQQRDIENSFLLEDYTRPTINLGKLTEISQAEEMYVEKVLSRINSREISRRNFKIVVQCENLQVLKIVESILNKLNCDLVVIMGNCTGFADKIPANQADLGLQLDTNAQDFKLFTEDGQAISEDQLAVLQTLVGLKDYGIIGIPVSAPTVVEELAKSLGVPAVRTKTRSRALLEIGKSCSLQVFYDGFYTLACMLEYLALKDTNITGVINSLPRVHTATDLIGCPPEAKGRVMRRLIKETLGQEVVLVDGVKVLTNDAWALILPDQEKAYFKLITQGASKGKVEELRGNFKRKILHYQKR